MPQPIAGEPIVRILRVLEYQGPRSWVEWQVASSIQHEKRVHLGHLGYHVTGVIRAATLGNWPEILQNNHAEDRKD